ncbi:rbcL [Symbiodinium necroappetens]|uniref:RbcL protein n=1 Tax=Symbiodinium necroappetens TaxID=1628268 RepID=A0A812LFW9_9DINO|nr:rbcL [Symbiodinium necroappetens]
MIKETDEGKLSSTKHTTDAPNEMTACDKYITFPFRVHTNILSCGKVEHDASGMKHIIHTDIMRLGKVEGDASDENFAVMQKDGEAKGPCCHEREGMKQTIGIHTDRMGFGKVEGDVLDEDFAVMQKVEGDALDENFAVMQTDVVEGDASDENFAVMQKDVEAKGPYCHEREGMKQTTGILTDTMRFGEVEGDASDKNFAVMQKDGEAKGPYCHEWEGMKQTTGIHTDRMSFGQVDVEQKLFGGGPHHDEQCFN